jgi:hypothetical protein
LVEISLFYPQKYFYNRKAKSLETPVFMGISRLFYLVAGAGFEPTTFGL